MAAILAVFVILKLGLSASITFYTVVYFWFGNRVIWYFIDDIPCRISMFCGLLRINPQPTDFSLCPGGYGQRVFR